MYNYFKRSRHSDRLKHGRITRTGFAVYTEENTMYDLHTHSRCSDGSESPEHVAELAKAAGIELLALTDHDCVRGVPAALSRAAQLGLRMLPGVEAEADYADKLHILGIGQDIDAPCFQKLLAEQTALREERNRLLEIKLRKMGMDVSDYHSRCLPPHTEQRRSCGYKAKTPLSAGCHRCRYGRGRSCNTCPPDADEKMRSA